MVIVHKNVYNKLGKSRNTKNILIMQQTLHSGRDIVYYHMQEGKSMTDSEKLDLIINELGNVKSDISELKNQVVKTQLHLEDRTDRNIELLAENHSTLINKLNEAIPAANNNLTYEVKVNYLLDRVSKLEKKVKIIEENNYIAN